jgi:hypothetical protein
VRVCHHFSRKSWLVTDALRSLKYPEPSCISPVLHRVRLRATQGQRSVEQPSPRGTNLAWVAGTSNQVAPPILAPTRCVATTCLLATIPFQVARLRQESDPHSCQCRISFEWTFEKELGTVRLGDVERGKRLIVFGVPDGTTLNRFRVIRSHVYHACDMSDLGRGGGRHGTLR